MVPACRFSVVLATVGLLLGCAGAEPATISNIDLVSGNLPGRWELQFQVSRGSPADSLFILRTVRASLVILDQPDSHRPDYFNATFAADFRPLLGRQVTCLGNPQAALARVGAEGDVELWLTPDAADCGLFARGRFDGRAVAGQWEELSFRAEPLSRGTFTMRRIGG